MGANKFLVLGKDLDLIVDGNISNVNFEFLMYSRQVKENSDNGGGEWRYS